MSVESCDDPNDCGKWIRNAADLWRVSADIEATWASVVYNLEATNAMASVQRPGKYNDPDMLQTGNVGLTLDEQRTQFGMWAFANAPMLISTDVTALASRPEILDILRAPEVIALNQDTANVQGVRLGAAQPEGVEMWAKRLAGDATVGVALLNKASTSTNATVSFADLGFTASDKVAVRDLWQREAVGVFSGTFSASVCSHCTNLYRFTKA